MKRIAFIALLTTYAFTGCQKQPKESDTTIPSGKESTDVIQLEMADQKIGYFLDQLDDPNTPMDKRKQIICKDYPATYYDEYVPALMKLSPENTQDQLKEDLEKVISYYKEKDRISC
ncbi:hypothetical protein BS636_13665 [Acinetobacter sp. LoGeW2-3]|uniref:hypothetical protein n=1 Tax=Acinetobacter sp. LoGeW2-3 TaxID=1808001 RepID=UPI000C05A5B2|nr:hypothetical protein [Acinetobacter sp. LoGeW2-3]ATO20647.1 hypothetical protein BS636_13665 [Acinetobacter sp. LoGeW2-3]